MCLRLNRYMEAFTGIQTDSVSNRDRYKSTPVDLDLSLIEQGGYYVSGVNAWKRYGGGC